MTPGRINQIAAFFSSPARAFGLDTPPLCYSGPPGARSARGLSFGCAERVCSSRLASRPTSSRPSCARLQDLPRANTSRFAILSTPLALLARRTPSRPLSRLFAWRSQLVLASSSRPAAAAPRISFHAETEGAPACLLRPLTVTEPVPVQTSPLSRLCPSSIDAPVRLQSQRAQSPALAATIQRGELL